MTVRKKFKITNMHCSSCSITIDGDLEDTEGVVSASSNFAKQMIEVEFDGEKIDDNQIIQIIKNSGYTAIAFES